MICTPSPSCAAGPAAAASSSGTLCVGLAGLLALPEELLLQCLQRVGAKGVARFAACCRRGLAVQEALAAQPAFSSAMVYVR